MRAALAIILICSSDSVWATGGDTARTEELITEVDARQNAVIEEGLQLGKFLGTLLVDTAAVLPKIEVGLLKGDLDLVNTALHGSETHRKIFEMCAEALTQTMEDLEQGTPGQKGYVTGRIVYEVASILLPFTKAGTLMQVTKAEVLTKLMGKANVLKPGAMARLTKVQAVCEGGCFLPDEPVLTNAGIKPICDIIGGDEVWSQNKWGHKWGQVF